MTKLFAFPIRLCLPILFGLAPSIGFADDRGPLEHDFQISVGGFFVSTDTELRLDGQTGRTGTDIDLERELDLEDKDRIRLDAFWRFAPNHKIRLMYFENNRSSSRELSEQIDFGDVSFPVSARVEAELKTQIMDLAYEYAFLHRDSLELSASIGIHDVKLSTALRGSIAAGNSGASAQAEEEASLNGPLPMLGLHVLWHMGGHFYLDGMAQFFYVEFDDIDGRIGDYKLGVTWYPVKHVGIGVAYNQFVTSVNVEKNAFDGRLRLAYGGALAHLTAGF